jgi:hypothetical protein
MESLPFLITGVPRSGTGYMAKLMQALGYDVGHEIIRPHGISSWLWAADSPTVPYGAPRNRAQIGTRMLLTHASHYGYEMLQI